jgi:hypothetical protein
MTETETTTESTPVKSVWFESLPPGTIEERKYVFYHIAPDGTRSVVNWSSYNSATAQAALRRRAVADFKKAALAQKKAAE